MWESEVPVEQGDLFVIDSNDMERNDGAATGFADLRLAPELCRALVGLGYEEPTPIQQAAIPPLLAGRELMRLGKAGVSATSDRRSNCSSE